MASCKYLLLSLCTLVVIFIMPVGSYAHTGKVIDITHIDKEVLNARISWDNSAESSPAFYDDEDIDRWLMFHQDGRRSCGSNSFSFMRSPAQLSALYLPTIFLSDSNSSGNQVMLPEYATLIPVPAYYSLLFRLTPF